MKHLLFVCVENSCRSQMAEAFAHIHGGNDVTAYSAGSRASGVVNPKAIASMAELGYDLTTHQSDKLDDLPAVKFDYAITMGCGDECPMIAATHRLDWELPDPKHMEPAEFNAVRDRIETLVKSLVEKLVS